MDQSKSLMTPNKNSKRTKSVIRTAGVIGGGIIGAWTALHLAEAGVKTTLFEQFPLPHTRGSSHGQSRAFRLLGDNELDRLDYSFDRWRDLEDATGELLFVKTGLLNFGTAGDPYLKKHMDILRAGGRPCEWLESHEIARRFPMMRYPEAWGAAWDPSGGILLAHRCLTAVQRKFESLGGSIVAADVRSIRSIPGSGVRIESRSSVNGVVGKIDLDTAVVCAGPWTGKLLPVLSEHLQPLLTPVTYWRDPEETCSVANGFPILFNARLTDMYGLPSFEYPGLVKVLYHGGPTTDPDHRDHASLAPYIELIRRYVAEYLPSLDSRQPAILETCMYTMTPDSEPIIDRLEPNLIVGCGFSGSGFKHSPATGQMLAAFALEREDLLPLGYATKRYQISRFS
jgi:sarcosine oxidase / L-pipecolate oxidase